MTYCYSCDSCSVEWEANLPMNDRDVPCSEECPHCSAVGSVKRILAAPGISYAGSKTILQRAGSGWNDVLNKVKKASGRNAKIETR